MWRVEQEVHWLAAYALGTAFARVRDEDAVRDILMVTTEPELLVGAREAVRHHASCDGATRSRALRLLDDAIAVGEPRGRGALTAARSSS